MQQRRVGVLCGAVRVTSAYGLCCSLWIRLCGRGSVVVVLLFGVMVVVQLLVDVLRSVYWRSVFLRQWVVVHWCAGVRGDPDGVVGVSTGGSSRAVGGGDK